MGMKFWIFRAIKVFSGILIALFFVELLKEHSVYDAVIFAFIWAFISTSIFIATRLYYSRKGQACALCNDTQDTSK